MRIRSSPSEMLSLNACRTFGWRLIDLEFFLDIWARVTDLEIIRVEMVTKVIGAKENIRERASHKTRGLWAEPLFKGSAEEEERTCTRNPQSV